MEAMEQERHLMRMPPFSQVDATALLQCIEEILPVGTREWDMVLTNYHERHAKPRDRPLRDRRMIRNKFYNLRYLKKGRTTLTHMERWANSIQTRIIARLKALARLPRGARRPPSAAGKVTLDAAWAMGQISCEHHRPGHSQAGGFVEGIDLGALSTRGDTYTNAIELDSDQPSSDEETIVDEETALLMSMVEPAPDDDLTEIQSTPMARPRPMKACVDPQRKRPRNATNTQPEIPVPPHRDQSTERHLLYTRLVKLEQDMLALRQEVESLRADGRRTSKALESEKEKNRKLGEELVQHKTLLLLQDKQELDEDKREIWPGTEKPTEFEDIAE